MRNSTQHLYTTADGTRLFYRHWPGSDQQRAFVLFHRGHEHSGRLQHIVDELGYPDAPMFAWDARGHGHSPGPRGFSPSLATSVADVDGFVRHLASTHGIALESITVIAQSVGAVLASTWVHDYAPPIRALVLAAPAFKVKLYVPFARPLLAAWHKLRGLFYVNSYVKPKFLTHDPQRIASYQQDPLISRPIAVNVLLDLYRTAERIVADAGAIRVPTQMLISGDDWVVEAAPQQRFFQQLGSTVKECHVLPGFYHDTLGEQDRALAFAKIRQFVDARYAEPLSRPAWLQADRSGYTAEEYRRLQVRPALWSATGLQFAISRTALGSLGRLSTGVRLGLTTGFDSGSTLDYVYRNRAQGWLGLGALFDRAYLSSLGWRGIRVRKQHLEQQIGDAIRRLRQAGQPVRLVDIAAGHGRYVLDAVAQAGGRIDHLLLRDYSPLNVAAGQRLIKERGLGDVAQFVAGNAFDRASLAQLDPAPTLAVVSGLYELFPENQPVADSLAGLAAAMAPGSYLVYTNQPWHPQLAFIAHVLSSHRDGKPWVMRRRTQGEMDGLVEAAGFRKLDQKIDDWGIFTVSIAVRT